MTDETSPAPWPPGFGVVPRDKLVSTSGVDFLRAMMAGDLPSPPFSHTAGVRGVLVEEGRVVFEGEPHERFYNPLGTVHGGWISMVLDTVLGCAVHSILKPGQAYTTLELKVNFVRPVLGSTGTVTAEGTIVHAGARVATSQATLHDAKGRLLAHGTSTCMILDVPAG